MVSHEVYALISEGEVKNVIVGDFYNCNEIARMNYGDDAFAVEVTHIPTEIGNKYINSQFLREENGEMVVIEPTPTEEQAIQMLTAENVELREQLDNLALAFLETTKGE